MEANSEDALLKFLLLGTEAEGELFNLTTLAARVCEAPAALILLKGHQDPSIKTSVGIGASELEERSFFLRKVAAHEEYFEISDFHSSPHAASSPPAMEKNMGRFCAGAPLESKAGARIGVLCVLYPNHTQLSVYQKDALKAFSRQIIDTFGLWHQRELLNIEKEKFHEKISELGNQNKMLKQIIDHVPHPIFVKDLTGKFLLVNKAQGELYGVTPKDLLGKDDMHFIKNVSEYEHVTKSDRQLLLGEHAVVLPEQEITLPDGSRKVLHTTKVPMVDFKNEKTILGISIDLTPLKDLEKAKEQSEEAYKKLVDLSPDAIFIHDWKEIIFVNPSGVEMLGASHPDELIGKSLFHFVPDENHSVFQETISLSCNKVTFAEAEFVTLSGAVLYTEVVAATFVHENRPVKQIIVRDITQKKKFQEDLYRSKEEFKALAEHSTDYICRVNTDLQYLYINRPITAEQHPVKFYLGKTPREVGFPENICQMMENNMKVILETGKPVSTFFEFPHTMAGRFQFNHMTSVPEFDKDGNITSAMISVRDVTELRQNEVKLQQTNKELDRFVYSASHELRAPLKSILGLTQIALNDFNMNNHQFQELYLKSIGGSIMRLDKLVNDIIDYSRNSRLNINVDKIDFTKLISIILQDLRYMEAVAIEKSLDIADDIPFYSDNGRLSIVLTNIISNVIKYADSKKAVNRMSVKIRVSSEKSIIEIEDNGIGIAEEHLDKICNMFFRAISSGESAGLGMYIVKETLDKLKGKMEIYSTLHEGTLFRVTIPNNDPE